MMLRSDLINRGVVTTERLKRNKGTFLFTLFEFETGTSTKRHSPETQVVFP
jgi:hypothetical protein